MNDLYHWHAEKMVELEMQELSREIEKARLLHEAGLSSPSWLVRKAKALSNWLIAKVERRQESVSTGHRASQTMDSKLST